MRLFGGCARCLKQYMIMDENQLSYADIRRISQQDGVIMPSSFNDIVNNYLQFNFVGNRTSLKQYPTQDVFNRVHEGQDIIFGSLCNYVQYFAEVGGFDALLQLFQMGMDAE